jgi:hypothetical protein
MMPSTMQAGVQYNDWKGSAAADDTDHQDAEAYLREKGLLKAGERLVAIRLWVGENHGTHKDPVRPTFILNGDYAEHDDGGGLPILREVSLEMPIAQFLGLFKRFEIVLTTRNGEVPHEYQAVSNDD